ncbi:hypothetical protein ACFYVK_12390 [Streptomyces chartreusis]|uniref:hypothetical protein n=1 Tax=Streptomyces chartreusis TaxID=1969 RepID=UPI0036948B77
MDRQPGGDGPLLAQRSASPTPTTGIWTASSTRCLDGLIDTLLSRADTTAQRIDDIALLALQCE